MRVGSTIDVDRRHKEYKRDGYTGTMWYSNTDKMKKAENSLLVVCRSSCSLNVQRASNQQEESRYVYDITN